MKCPKYDSCSAAMCPIYKPISQQYMLPSERVCSVLLEAQKPDSEAILIAQYGKEIYELIAEATAWVKAHGAYPIRRALICASQTGSRLQSIAQLRKSEVHCEN
jgi:hypothetical protein